MKAWVYREDSISRPTKTETLFEHLYIQKLEFRLDSYDMLTVYHLGDQSNII
jgi:hypothetical protein